MGGKNGLTIWDGDEDNARSYYDQPEIEGGAEQGPNQPSLDEADEFSDDGAWYMGKARDEFNRRKRGQHDDRAQRAAELGDLGVETLPVQRRRPGGRARSGTRHRAGEVGAS